MQARRVEKYLIFLSDIVSFNLSFAFIFWLRYQSGFFAASYNPHKDFGPLTSLAFLLSLIWILYFFLSGLYRDWYLQSRAEQVWVVSKKITFGFFLLFLIIAGSDIVDAYHNNRLHGTFNLSSFFTLSRAASLLSFWGVFVISVNGFRLLVQAQLLRLLRRGVGLEPLLILGANETGARISQDVRSNPEMGFRVFGFADENGALKGGLFIDLPVLGTYSDLPEIIRQHRIKAIIISHESTSHNEILRILSYVAEFPVSLFIVPDLYDAASGHFKTHAVHGMTLKVLFPEHMPAWEAQIKRLMDIFISAALLLFTLPITLAAALSIRLTSKGPIFYSQERIGQYGKRIWVHKFRTMRTDAELAGPQWASAKDPRVTPVGRFLRRARIDELPQLWCVLKGEMSLVGPRPERQHFIDQLKHEVPLYLRRLKMKPGLTGWAQVKHKYDASIDDVKTKVMFDLWYFENMSLGLDLLILLRTVWVVITGHGAR